MAGLLDTVQRFRKLETATAPSDDPAPVYLLDEIADMARQSPEGAQAIADAVQKKLQVKSPVVKFKALRIIKHLCTKGCSQFQRCMQRHSSAVRELIHWRGEPDPFKGDVPNARVREFAKEVVEVMFNTTPATNTTTNTLAAQGKIQGFGSGGQDAGSSSGHYGGIGSSGTGGYGGGFRSSGAVAGGGFAAAQSAASQLSQAAQQALGEGPIAAGLASAASALGGLLQPGGYGSKLNDGGYRDAGGSDYGYASASSYSAPEVAAVSASQVLGSEAALVDDITTPSGLRPLPDPRDLARFVDAAGNLDGLRLAELLREKMESPRWQVVLRALAALEAVLQRGSSRGCGEVAVMFQSEPSPVRRGLASPQPQVQQVAAAVLKLLTGEEAQQPAAGAAGKKGPAAAAAAAKAAPVADLLIDDGPSEAVPAAAAGGGAAGIDLLGDLSSPSPAPPAAAAAAGGAGVDSLFDGLGVAATSNGAADLFGGLEVAAPAAPAAAAPVAAPAAAPKQQQQQQQQQQQPVPAAAPLDELFSGLSTATAGPTSSSSPMQPAAQQPQQQQQQRPALPDLLGDLASSPVKQQQPAGLLGMSQANGLPQQQPQFGMGLQPGLGMQQQQQWQPLGASKPGGFGGPSQAAAGGQHHGAPGMAALGGGGGSGAWAGHDDVLNLMRHVSHGGKYDPAFDFVSQEFKKK